MPLSSPLSLSDIAISLVVIFSLTLPCLCLLNHQFNLKGGEVQVVLSFLPDHVLLCHPRRHLWSLLNQHRPPLPCPLHPPPPYHPWPPHHLRSEAQAQLVKLKVM